MAQGVQRAKGRRRSTRGLNSRDTRVFVRVNAGFFPDYRSSSSEMITPSTHLDEQKSPSSDTIEDNQKTGKKGCECDTGVQYFVAVAPCAISPTTTGLSRTSRRAMPLLTSFFASRQNGFWQFVGSFTFARYEMYCFFIQFFQIGLLTAFDGFQIVVLPY